MSEGGSTLVATPQDADVEPLTSAEGAGVASSWADLAKALNEDELDGAQIAFTAAGAGLDTLGAIVDPFDAVAASAVGWVIEHVAFLHEPLDALAGDPKQVVAHAQTWRNVANELASVAADYRTATAEDRWDGAAGDAYGTAVDGYTGALRAVAAQADELSTVVIGAGAAIGTVRAIVRDLIADFLVALAPRALAALAAMAPTAGASVAAFVTSMITHAVALAQRIARRISRLLDALSDAGGTAGQIVDGMRHVATEISAAAPYLRTTSRDVVAALDSVPVPEVVEAGKQFTGAKLNDEAMPASSS